MKKQNAIIIFNKETQAPLILPWISQEELQKFYYALKGVRASRRFHNTGENGLFLHSLQVAYRVMTTPGFQQITTEEMELLFFMGMFHDGDTKFPKEYEAQNLLNIVGQCIYHYFGKREELANYFYDLLMHRHHGFIDGALLPMKVYQDYISSSHQSHTTNELLTKITNFVAFIYEVSRCDAYDAGYSYGKLGDSWLEVMEVESKEDIERE
jgi:hypothetical protein